MKYRLIGTLLGVCFGLFMSWIGGFDFDERGALAFFCILMSLGTSCLGYSIGEIYDR